LFEFIWPCLDSILQILCVTILKEMEKKKERKKIAERLCARAAQVFNIVG
jgi:hypothetical protein